jgi:hypothetical protein
LDMCFDCFGWPLISSSPVLQPVTPGPVYKHEPSSVTFYPKENCHGRHHDIGKRQ